jgi:hypothetical protein
MVLDKDSERCGGGQHCILDVSGRKMVCTDQNRSRKARSLSIKNCGEAADLTAIDGGTPH